MYISKPLRWKHLELSEKKKWWVESDFKAPNLPLSLRLKVSGCHYNSIYNSTWTKQLKQLSNQRQMSTTLLPHVSFWFWKKLNFLHFLPCKEIISCMFYLKDYQLQWISFWLNQFIRKTGQKQQIITIFVLKHARMV
jgi:hypothetical protein